MPGGRVDADVVHEVGDAFGPLAEPAIDIEATGRHLVHSVEPAVDPRVVDQRCGRIHLLLVDEATRARVGRPDRLELVPRQPLRVEETSLASVGGGPRVPLTMLLRLDGLTRRLAVRRVADLNPRG
jgi:hypothetical protein